MKKSQSKIITEIAPSWEYFVNKSLILLTFWIRNNIKQMKASCIRYRRVTSRVTKNFNVMELSIKCILNKFTRIIKKGTKRYLFVFHPRKSDECTQKKWASFFTSRLWNKQSVRHKVMLQWTMKNLQHAKKMVFCIDMTYVLYLNRFNEQVNVWYKNKRLLWDGYNQQLNVSIRFLYKDFILTLIFHN